MFGHFQTIQFVLPCGQTPPRPHSSQETLMAITEGTKTDKTRDEFVFGGTRNHKPSPSLKTYKPDLPDHLGPPPAFCANVLEASLTRHKNNMENEAVHIFVLHEKQLMTPTKTGPNYGDGTLNKYARMLDFSR